MKHIRKSKFAKVLSSYLAIQLLITTVQPSNLFALTSGPSQPEFNTFTPIGTSDMVNLSTGDFNYNIPIMDVGGYPLNLAYDSGITMDEEASWVGLGWNLSVGQISRNVRGIPDDFKGDEMIYENDMRDNVTIGTNFNVKFALFGKDKKDSEGNDVQGDKLDLSPSIGLGVSYNNYSGITFKPSYGASYAINDNLSLGLSASSTTGEGVTISPQVNFGAQIKNKYLTSVTDLTGGFGVSLNSRKGLENMSLSFTRKKEKTKFKTYFIGNNSYTFANQISTNGGLNTGISFNDLTNFTPKKRVGLTNDSFTFTSSFGGTFFGVQGQAQVTGYGTYQKVRTDEKHKTVPAFGYQHTDLANSPSSILDFTREKETSFNEYTAMLPVTNYSYDMYSIQGQGIGGMFRPHRSQVGYVYDSQVSDFGGGKTLGAELGGGNAWYVGARIQITSSNGTTKKWENGNNALPKFEEGTSYSNHLREKVFFRTIGDIGVDKEIGLYNDEIHGESPISLTFNGGQASNQKLESSYQIKKPSTAEDEIPVYEEEDIDDKISREERYLRNQSIQMITLDEAYAEADPQGEISAPYPEMLLEDLPAGAKGHHTIGAKILKPDGSTYVYGNRAYNTKKIEATFDVSGQSNTASLTTGLVNYSNNFKSNTTGSSNQFFNRITTPVYAHTYLLSSVLSSDYEDLTRNGPTDDDLGAYTKFAYTKVAGYKWRVPFQTNKASYNEGLKTNDNDETGNYIYGEKELKYIQKIETKTHVAIFELSDRKDAIGVKGETGGRDATSKKMKRIDKIFLYSKPEYKTLLVENFGIDHDDIDYAKKVEKSIKVAHFNYKYSLCKPLEGNLPNNDGIADDGDNDGENDNLGGKLTLNKVYFTYRDSNMGKYTPYVFKYHNSYVDADGNEKPYSYNLKGNDIWGNYKPNDHASTSLDDDPSAPEFSFVEQNEDMANAYSKAWTLDEIDLPSGGKIKIETESDDYQFVQDRKAMQMFKISGAGNTATIDAGGRPDIASLYNGNTQNKFVYMKLPKIEGIEPDDMADFEYSNFIERFVGNQLEAPIHFRFLLNMTTKDPNHYDYVEGYFLIDKDTDGSVFKYGDDYYASIPMQYLEQQRGIFPDKSNVNPISKAGWYFGRTHLNQAVYGKTGSVTSKKFEDIVGELLSSIDGVSELFAGPNKKLKEKGCARLFKPKRSWIRLLNPNGTKFGGGLRVKTIKMLDQWDKMTDTEDRYAQQYGQEYEYKDSNGVKSSGVATFEPNGSKENPFVVPIFDKEADNFADQIAAPRESNYTEKPMGESFFPSPLVTYSRVKVKNLERKDDVDGGREVKSNATGYVVNEFYTSNDFPTITDYTKINSHFYESPKILGALKLNSKKTLTLSQGFVVITNDMNGKMKNQAVYAEGKENPISKVVYRYNVSESDPKKLDNFLTTIDDKGIVKKQLVAQQYDVVNDFIENTSNTTVGGVDANLTTFLAGIFPGIVPVPLPNLAVHNNTLHAAITTKVIHKMGILIEKEAYDLGAKVSTENLAWDAATGQVLLTKTINEYDNNYYNFTYPAYWHNVAMGMASNNIGFEGDLEPTDGTEGLFDLITPFSSKEIDFPLCPGDMLQTYDGDAVINKNEILWVVSVINNKVNLMDIDGNVINHECSPDTKSSLQFKVIRSGYKNTQMASMASITSMVNPIDVNNDGNMDTNITNSTLDNSVINASAVMYNEYWKPQDQLGLPRLTPSVLEEFNKITDNEVSTIPNIKPTSYGFNPYLYNVLGEWRAVESYAYLTGRTSNISSNNKPELKNDGHFKTFTPFYKLNNNSWGIDDTNWTSASTVTEYSPYGAELENKDALNRYSSAQYGYAYTLPIAVASNSKYQNTAFDGFEDYEYNNALGSNSAVLDENEDEFTRDHFSFKKPSEESKENGAVVTGVSHTGNSSLEVSQGSKVEVTKGLVAYNHALIDVNCNPGNPNQDYGDRFTVNITQYDQPDPLGDDDGNSEDNCTVDPDNPPPGNPDYRAGFKSVDLRGRKKVTIQGRPNEIITMNLHYSTGFYHSGIGFGVNSFNHDAEPDNIMGLIEAVLNFYSKLKIKPIGRSATNAISNIGLEQSTEDGFDDWFDVFDQKYYFEEFYQESEEQAGFKHTIDMTYNNSNGIVVSAGDNYYASNDLLGTLRKLYNFQYYGTTKAWYPSDKTDTSGGHDYQSKDLSTYKNQFEIVLDENGNSEFEIYLYSKSSVCAYGIHDDESGKFNTKPGRMDYECAQDLIFEFYDTTGRPAEYINGSSSANIILHNNIFIKKGFSTD